MSITYAVNVLLRPVRPKWMVYQTRLPKNSNVEDLVYAQTFYRRSSAEKAQKAANERMGGIKSASGNRAWLTSRRFAVLVKLPYDGR